MEYVCDVSLWDSLLLEHGYELLGQIDSGSFSDVFAVRRTSSCQALAVKRMVARREIMSDPRVLAEISCLKQLGSRGTCVIRLEDTIIRPDRLACLVLELAPLGDLERHTLKHWPLTQKLLTSACRQVLSALSHCHRLHIAHRDLNPANVLLMSAHSVRLADFGLAFRCRDSHGRRLACEDYLGRESYLAPEVLQQEPYDAVLADMWSMGSLCLFMLTGKHPPPAKTNCVCWDRDRPRRAEKERDRPSYALKGSHHTSRFPGHCRTSSCDSEGSYRSESDVEETLPLFSVSDSDPSCASSRLTEPFLDGSDFSHGCVCEEEVESSPPWAPSGDVLDVFKDSSCAVDRAIRHLMSRLRLEEPGDRLSSEEALQLWKHGV